MQRRVKVRCGDVNPKRRGDTFGNPKVNASDLSKQSRLGVGVEVTYCNSTRGRDSDPSPSALLSPSAADRFSLRLWEVWLPSRSHSTRVCLGLDCHAAYHVDGEDAQCTIPIPVAYCLRNRLDSSRAVTYSTILLCYHSQAGLVCAQRIYVCTSRQGRLKHSH
jgi:hypothetical protein